MESQGTITLSKKVKTCGSVTDIQGTAWVVTGIYSDGREQIIWASRDENAKPMAYRVELA